MSATYIIIAIVAISVLGIVSTYNTLVKNRNNRENAIADIDVQLKQRHDLIPQRIGSVKGYMEHERGTLENITAARTRAINATTINEKIAAETELGAALQGLNI